MPCQIKKKNDKSVNYKIGNFVMKSLETKNPFS